MRGYNFGWKAPWDSNPDWSCLSHYCWRRSGTPVKPSCLGKLRAVPRLCVLRPGISFATEEKITGKKRQDSRKVPDGHDSVCRHGHLLTGSQDKFVDPGLPLYNLGDLGKTLCQRRYLPSCVTKVCPTSANFESNLSVRDLTWSQRMELTNPREYDRHQCTEVHWWHCEDTWFETPEVS